MKSPILNFTPDQRLKVGEELAEQYKNAPFGKNQLPRLNDVTLPTGKGGRPFNYQGPVDPGFYTDRRPLPMPFPGFDRANPIQIGGPVLPRPFPMPEKGIITPPAPVPPVGGGMIRPQPAPPRFGGIRGIIGRGRK